MKKVTLKIDGMHCTSCALNIDFALEDIGVKAKTNYAKSETELEFDPEKVSEKQIIDAVKKVGYTIQPDSSLSKT